MPRIGGGTVTLLFTDLVRSTELLERLGDDAAGRLETAALPNGITTTYTYDAAGRLLELVNEDGTPAVLSSYEYTLDAVGNRTQVVDTIGTTTYEYDALYQLTGVTYPNDDEQSYTYDAMGNRLTKTHNETTIEYEYDAADQLVSADAVAYDYDENGNQVERGSDTFAWDHEDRLTDTEIDSVAGSYGYNGDGLRASRTLGASSVSYVWDVGSPLPVILQDSDDNTYVFGLDPISRTDDQGDQEYYLYDGLGSTTGLTDETGALVASYEYDVFGALRDSSGTSQNEFTFTGEQNDPTGLEYLRARYYDQATGRFLSRDRLRFIQRYAYVGNNPVNYVDPTGDCLIEIRLTKVFGYGWWKFNVTAWHTYVYTYDPTDGTSVAFQGGPENESHGFLDRLFRMGSDASGSDNAPGGGGLGFGNLEVWTEVDDRQFEGPKKVVHEEDKESCDSWRATFTERMDLINGMDIEFQPYDGPNSNSATHSLLAAAGLSTKKPGARRFWTDKYWVPGWESVGP